MVGGAVRSFLLQRGNPDSPNPKDFDIATSARPEEVQRIFARTIPTGIQHGTVTVPMGDLAVEVTTFRADGAYGDARRPDSVEYVEDLTTDLARRDFTINAMAYDPLKEELVDPFEGQLDLQAGRIRAVGDPVKRFAEDGLRLLRAARFAAQLDFKIDFSTREAMTTCADMIHKISRERARDELLKLLGAPTYMGVVRGLFALFQTGLVREAFSRKLEAHLLALDIVSEWAGWVASVSPTHRLAAFLWLVREDPQEVRRALSSLKLPNAEQRLAEGILRFPLVATLDLDVVAVRKIMAQHPPEVLDGALEIQSHINVREKVAEFKARVDRERQDKTPLHVRDLKIDGEDLAGLGVPRGPAMGQILADLLDHVLRNPADNVREVLAEKVRQMAK